MKMKLIKKIYFETKLPQTEKSMMTVIILNMNKEKECTLSLIELAKLNSVTKDAAWRFLRRLISKNYILRNISSINKRFRIYKVLM